MKFQKTKAQIYLADQRGVSQVGYFRSFHTFNFGGYFDESRKPFGNLQVLNDDTLNAGYSLKMQLQENTDVIIIPIVGGLEYKNSLSNGFLEAGQVQIFSATASMFFEIINPYETETINFIQIWLKKTDTEFDVKNQITSFNLQDKNQLLPIFSINDQQGFIGKYDGRKKDELIIERNVFAFVIDGVFEVQDRLLHARDGLALSNFKAIDFEALTKEAVILVIKTSPYNST